MYMKRYWLINLICIVLSAGFLFGMVWVWRGTDEIDYEAELRIANSKIENVKIKMENNVARVNAALPPQYFISVPFTSQAPEKNWDQPWQDACEDAAVLMMDAYYKQYNLSPLFARDEIIKMVDWEEREMGWDKSIEIEKVEELMEYYFGQAKFLIVENPTVEQIKNYVAEGRPVLMVADGKVLPNPHFRNGGPEYHALIIRGYTEDSFITNDPGTQFGENFVYQYNDLMNAIRDW